MCGMKRTVYLGLSGMLAVQLVAASTPNAQKPDAQPSGDPVGLVRAWLDAGDAGARAAIAARIVSHRDYRPARVREWLHRAASFSSLRPGIDVMRVDVGEEDSRQVVIRVPDGYRPDRPWPLVYALHPSGMQAADWAARVEGLLGMRSSQYVIAAPNQYRQNYIAADPPFTPEHPAILDAIARRVHVAHDRVYVVGYSKGAYGAWFVSLYYPDRFAGAVALAGTFDVAVGDDGFWKTLVTNVAQLPVLNIWGERDTLTVRGLDGTPAGDFSTQNRRFEQWLSGMGLPITNIEVPGAGHHDLRPPPEPIEAALVGRRREDPKRIDQVFRHLHQASCYWLEGLSWVGERWGERRPPLPAAQPGESERHVIARTLEPLLGRLTGTIDRQTIRVSRRHIGDLVIWFGERDDRLVAPRGHRGGRSEGVRGDSGAEPRRVPRAGGRHVGLRRASLGRCQGGRLQQGTGAHGRHRAATGVEAEQRIGRTLTSAPNRRSARVVEARALVGTFESRGSGGVRAMIPRETRAARAPLDPPRRRRWPAA